MNNSLVLKLFITIIILLQLSNASQTHNQLDPSLKEEKKEKLSASQSISDIVSKASRKLSKHTNVIVNKETPTDIVKEKAKSVEASSYKKRTWAEQKDAAAKLREKKK